MCKVGMATVPKLIKLLVSFHKIMLVKCLEECLASGKHSIKTDFTDVGETAQARLLLVLRNVKVSCWVQSIKVTYIEGREGRI